MSELLEALKMARSALFVAVCAATTDLYETRKECEQAALKHRVIKVCDAAIVKAETSA